MLALVLSLLRGSKLSDNDKTFCLLPTTCASKQLGERNINWIAFGIAVVRGYKGAISVPAGSSQARMTFDRLLTATRTKRYGDRPLTTDDHDRK